MGHPRYREGRRRRRKSGPPVLNTSFTYDDLGNLLSSTDPLHHVTNYSYADSWSGSGCVGSSNTYGLLTQMTNALNFRTQASYYPCSGLIQSKRDENDIKAGRTGSTFAYDNMNRLLTATDVAGGQTSYDYHGDALPLEVTQRQLITSSITAAHTTTYDGAGRAKTSSLDSDPAGADLVDTTYDNLGRVASVSNPHSSSSLPTDGITQTQYDALGRPVQVTKQDGSVANVSYVGNCTTATDEAGKARKSCSDALGRLTTVFEDPTGFNYEDRLSVRRSRQSDPRGAERLRSYGQQPVAHADIYV
jgi:YD repeat-containing protein